jgi:hypothetical protein
MLIRSLSEKWMKPRYQRGFFFAVARLCNIILLNHEKEHAMAHWQNRPEPGWQKFKFNQPYEKGLKRLKEEVLAKTDFDPATLWQWGTMQAMAIIEVLKACERQFGAAGQQVVCDSLHKIGLDIGRQVLRDTEKPDDMTVAEFMSYYATVINRIVYASLEDPKIDSEEQVSFDIVWCPHQDHYEAFDCRVQRYFVQGMLEAMQEFSTVHNFEVRFDSTIPAGAPTCHFTIWRASGAESEEWAKYTKLVELKALKHAAQTPEQLNAGKETQ